VVLTGAEVDTLTGLLTLRERQSFRPLRRRSGSGVLAENPIFRALNPDVVTREEMALNTPFAPAPA
jgi:pyrroloquinoline quinone biosynthesis protein B